MDMEENIMLMADMDKQRKDFVDDNIDYKIKIHALRWEV